MVTTKANSERNEIQATDYLTMEERMKMHDAICKGLGEDLTPESYMRFCGEHAIGVSIIPPAYGWEP